MSGTTNNGILTLNSSAPNATVEQYWTIDGQTMTGGGAVNMNNNNILNVGSIGMNDNGIGEGIMWEDGSIDYRIAVAAENIGSETYETLHIQNHAGAGKLRVWGFDEISFQDGIRIHSDSSNTLTDQWSMEYDSTSDDLVFNFLGT